MIKNSFLTRLLIVLMAYVLMVSASCFVMFRTLNAKLLQNANEMMNDTSIFLSHLLNEPEVILNFIADNIEGMYQRGEELDLIKNYMTECSSERFKERAKVVSYYSVFGYFDKTDEFFDGGGWQATEDYDPKIRLWYIAAMSTENEVAITTPYIDADSQVLVIAYTRRIFDADGSPIGIICIDVKFEYLQDLVINQRITPESYGYMVDENLYVIIHPYEGIQGEILGDYNPDMKQFGEVIAAGKNISLQRVKNYMGTQTVLFGRQLEKGWYLMAVVPEAEYYKELYDMLLVVGLLGAVLAAALIIILIRLEMAIRKSEAALSEKLVSEKQRIQQLEAAEMASRAKSEFLATMSHEIRTPMNSIMGFAELGQDSDSVAQMKTYMERISDSSKWLLHIINDILDISKIEAGKMVLDYSPFDLHDVFSRCQSVILPDIKEKGLDFGICADPSINNNIMGDSVRLYQVLMNLLTNAVKFTSKGTITFSFVIKNTDADSATIYFEVKDTGIGMTKEQIGKVFDLFMQADSSTTRNYGGTGLGLSIAKNIVELMGGKLHAESTPGVGSLFSFELTFKLSYNKE